MSSIRTLMADSATKPSDLSLVASVVGPGSFMGLRVGIAAARAMALGLSIEAVGVSRMRALARGMGPVRIVLDARRGQVFEQSFDAQNEPVDDLRTTTTEVFRLGPEPLAGSGVTLVGNETANPTDVPTLSAVATLAREHPLPPRPLYGRGADAKRQQPATFPRSSQR